MENKDFAARLDAALRRFEAEKTLDAYNDFLEVFFSGIRDNDRLQDIKISVNLLGNAFGAQQLYLRRDDQGGNYICVELVNNELVVLEKLGGSRKELYREKIPVILGEKIPSVEEDRREVETQANLTFARYATSKEQAAEYLSRAKNREEMPAASVEEGAEPYQHVQSFHSRSKHELKIDLKGDKMTVLLDGKEGPQKLRVGVITPGSICLGASWQGEAWSQRNLADDVYDAVFEKFLVTSNKGKEDEDDEKVIFTTKLTGTDKVLFCLKEAWETVLFWFLKNA